MQLSKDQFAVLSALLDQGLDLPEGERSAWLEGLTEPFAGARALLTGMLAGDAGGSRDAFLDTIPKLTPGMDAGARQPAGLQAGSRIGVYVLIREIGQGGMATVWLARRTDALTQRMVALKLPHLHLQGARYAERFARERDILADLTHPNIAHLYDAGISAEGQPFLAMEYVAGVPLTDYCNARALGLEERLQLFLQVLAAVDYAHSAQVIHRDLKPSNILVRADGGVVLLDFGIARLLVDGEDEQTLTAHGAAVLTPHYASPEQIRGEALGPATDVFSLGVILYELLSGHRPHEISGTTRRALEAAILTAEPRRPSDRIAEDSRTGEAHAASSSLRSRLRGDLDTIVLKALKKDPGERYATVSAFADDLRRFLRGETVSARPDTAWYRLRRLAHRHRPALRGAAVAALALAVAGVIATRVGGLQLARHATAEAPATTNATGRGMVPLIATVNSVAVLPFVDLSEDKDHEYFADGLSAELIDDLAHSPNLKVIARTSSFRFKGTTADMRTIGRQLGVAKLLEGSVRVSGDHLRVAASLFNVSDGTRLWSETYDRELKDMFAVQDAIATAVVASLQANLIQSASFPHQPGNAEAYSAFLRGQFLSARKSRDDLRRALAAFRESVRLDPGYARAWVGIADVYNYQGLLGLIPPKTAYREGRKAIDRALAIQPDMARGYLELSALEWNYQFDFEKSRTALAKARSLDPTIVLYDDVEAYDALLAGRYDYSVRLFRELIQHDPVSLFRWDQLANTLWSAGRLVEAEQAMHTVLDLDPRYPYSHCNLGEMLLEENKPDAALAIMQQEADEGSRWCVTEALWALGRHSEADAVLAKATARYADTDAQGFAGTYALRGDKDAAFAWLNRAYENREPGLTIAGADPTLRSLRGDPRFTALLRRMNLPLPQPAGQAAPATAAEPTVPPQAPRRPPP